jgi:glycosyltransferase involved in cell wall biosynthesis
MRITFVSHLDPNDPGSYSGTTGPMLRALRATGLIVRAIGPLVDPLPAWFKLKHAMYKLRGQSYGHDRELRLLDSYARQVRQQLGDADLVFSPESVGIAHLQCSQPMVMWPDATFPSMVGFYWKNLAAQTIANGLAMEQRAMNACRLNIFSSQWAADSAVYDCKIDAAKVRVVEYGANLDENLPQLQRDEVLPRMERRPTDCCNLLCIGVDWHRKGMDFAVEVARELNYLGVRTTLRLVGCQPPPGTMLPDFVRQLGFISKSTAQGQKQLIDLFAESHFFTLPSKAETFGIVFAEAAALATPSVATAVGGILTVIEDGVNGYVFDRAAPAIKWAQRIAAVLSVPANYRDLCMRARQEYESRLSWRVAGERVRQLLA